MESTSPAPSVEPRATVWTFFGFRNRVLLTIAALVSLGIFWWAGALFHIPTVRGYEASLIHQPLSLVVTAVVLIVCVVLGTLIAGTVRFDAGLFAATVGLAALSMRGGPMRILLLTAGSDAIFFRLVAEIVILFGMVGLAWSVLWLLHRGGRLKADEFRDGVEDQQEPLGQKICATAAHVLTMVIAMMIFAQSDDKAQALAAVAIAGFLGSLGAYALFPVSPSVWYWIGPMITGAIGYGYLGLKGAPGWNTGQPANELAPLAGPLPLDYASFGAAAAILGYWMSRRWHSDSDEAEPSSAG